MDRAASLFLVAVTITGFARQVSTVPPPPPTTTPPTTTTTSPEPIVVSSGPVEAKPNACLRCEARFDRYRNIVIWNNLTALPAVLGQLCDNDLPAVEQCRSVADRGRCHRSIMTETFKFLCRHKADVRNGLACWSAGYREAIARCLRSFITTSRESTCRKAPRLIFCVRESMEAIQSCSDDDISFIVNDYVKFSLTFLCGPLLRSSDVTE